jgi:hypothetical protein
VTLLTNDCTLIRVRKQRAYVLSLCIPFMSRYLRRWQPLRLLGHVNTYAQTIMSLDDMICVECYEAARWQMHETWNMLGC